MTKGSSYDVEFVEIPNAKNLTEHKSTRKTLIIMRSVFQEWKM
jgi:hypothetical protein